MSLITTLIVSSLVAAVVLLLDSPDRLLPAAALVIAGLELLIRLQIIRFGVAGLHWGVLGGIALAVLAAVLWVRASGKTGATAATVLLMSGLLQVWLLK